MGWFINRFGLWKHDDFCGVPKFVCLWGNSIRAENGTSDLGQLALLPMASWETFVILIHGLNAWLIDHVTPFVTYHTQGLYHLSFISIYHLYPTCSINTQQWQHKPWGWWEDRLPQPTGQVLWRLMKGPQNIQPRVPLQGITPEEIIQNSRKDLCPPVSLVTLFKTTNNWKQMSNNKGTSRWSRDGH